MQVPVTNLPPYASDWSRLTHWSHSADVLGGRTLAIVGLVVLGLVLRWVIVKVIGRMVRHLERSELADRLADRLSTSDRRVQRIRTLGDILKSVATGVLVAVFGTMILGELGVNIAPILASAGIVGVALGFGAQSMVKDFLSGIFMIAEDQFGVGDVVDVGVASGTVEAVSMRVTRLRDVNGTVWYVPNGQILKVGNQSQNWSRAVVDTKVGYAEDLSRVQRVLTEVAHDLWNDDDFTGVMIEQPEVTGVEAIDPESATLRVMVKTAPMQQWGVARELRKRIKARLDHEGITPKTIYTANAPAAAPTSAPATGA